MRSFLLAAGAAAILILSGCDRPTALTGLEDLSSEGPDVVASYAKKGGTMGLAGPGAAIEAEMMALMEEVNGELEVDGANYRVATSEWLTADMAGKTVWFRDRGNKQMAFHFVPNDPRRLWSGSPAGPGDDITWAVDQTSDAAPLLGGLSATETDAAITRAMATWDGQRCSNLPLNRFPDFGIDIGVTAFLNGLGGSPFVVADIQHAGFSDMDFGEGVLGVTFTFMFTTGGVPTDIDRNGKIDVAFREIYYDPSSPWALNGDYPNIDVETVAVHETGHGLSQDHFGKLFQTKKNGKYHWAPFALMNAGYVGVQRELTGTDRGGHCGIWASWPNN